MVRTTSVAVTCMGGLAAVGAVVDQEALGRVMWLMRKHRRVPHAKWLIPAFINNTSKADAEKRGKELLDFLGLSHRTDHKPSELSGGEQQRVAVARALVNNPGVIFADEPSGNLDSESAENLHKLFFDLREKFGQTFIIVTHNEELANMADRKLVMQDGLIVK